MQETDYFDRFYRADYCIVIVFILFFLLVLFCNCRTTKLRRNLSSIYFKMLYCFLFTCRHIPEFLEIGPFAGLARSFIYIKSCFGLTFTLLKEEYIAC